MTGAAPLEAESTAALLALERRGVLRLLAAAALATVAPACAAPPPPPGPPLAALSPRTWAVLTAAAARIAGPAAGALVLDGRLPAGRIADTWLARTPSLAAPLGQALLVLEFGMWPLVAKVRPFTALDGAAQDRVLDALRRSRLALARQIFQGVRGVALLGVYLAPAARPLIAYPPPFGNDAVTIGDAMAPLPPDA